MVIDVVRGGFMRRLLATAGYFFKRPHVLKSYVQIRQGEKKGVHFLKQQQDAQLRILIDYSVKNVPYYRQLFCDLGLTPEDIKGAEDLVKLPILTKEIIRKDPSSFIPINFRDKFFLNSTGGSTGVPLTYRLSNGCYARGVAIFLRGLGYAGYHLGDKLAIVAGTSLVSSSNTLKGKLQDYVLNYKHYLTCGMDEDALLSYYNHLRCWKPHFLRGYASSLYLLAKFLDENSLDLGFRFKGIFSTSELLTQQSRLVIEKVFKTKVFDNYGLNDGGVSAYECSQHKGMHIDFERAVMETVDEGNNPVKNGLGKILATSLYNYAFPFIRYDTGDLGIISEERCTCGCERPLLKEICGRSNDYLKLNGKIIASVYPLMKKVDVEYYQIIQISSNEVEIRLIKGKTFSQEDESFITDWLTRHGGNVKVSFKEVTPSYKNEANKHKFIINEVCK